VGRSGGLGEVQEIKVNRATNSSCNTLSISLQLIVPS
jgi:hypothetical protein